MIDTDDKTKDDKETRKHVVRCRLNDYEFCIFELLMKLRDQSHSDVLRLALLNELNKPIYEPLDLDDQYAKNWLANYVYRVKRPRQTLRVINKFQHIDPALIKELSAIGNNLNQIARALNILKQEDPRSESRANFDYLQMLFILQNIANDIAPILHKLPKRKRNESRVKAEVRKKRIEHLVKRVEKAM